MHLYKRRTSTEIDLKLVVCPTNGNVRYFLSDFLAPLKIYHLHDGRHINHIIVVKAKSKAKKRKEKKRKENEI
jgi:hypothetical protein